MVWSLFSFEKKVGDQVSTSVGFLRRVVIATMGCFFGCFGSKDSQAQFIAPQETVEPRNKNALSSLFLSDDELTPTADIKVRELKDQAKFLKACGTLPETPLAIRKDFKRWEDITSNDGEQQILNFNTIISPNASFEKSKLNELPVELSPPVKSIEEVITGTGSLVDSPISCMTDGHDNGRLSISSLHYNNLQDTDIPSDAHCNATNSSEISSGSVKDFAPNVQFKTKSVRFDCNSDKSQCSLEGTSQTAIEHSKGSGSDSNCSASKPSPYPTPLKLTDDMQTPGTVFPAYLNSVGHGKTAKVRSQHVHPVLNPVENLSKRNDQFIDADMDFKNLSTCHKLTDEAVFVSTTKIEVDHSFEKELKDETDLTSWFKPLAYNQEDSRKRFSPPSGENIYLRKTPGDRPILGMVAAHWNENETSHISPRWWDGNGIPNSTNKYKEDQKVSWHATPFEERLEKALSAETFISKRKPINGTPPVDFNAADESETPLSNFQSSPHFNSAVSC